LDQAMMGSTRIFLPEGISAPVGGGGAPLAAAAPMAAAPALDVHAVANAALAAAGVASNPAQAMMMGGQQQPMMGGQQQQPPPMMMMPGSQQQPMMQAQPMMGQPIMQQQAMMGGQPGQPMMGGQGQPPLASPQGQPPLAPPQGQPPLAPPPSSGQGPSPALSSSSGPGGKTRILVLLNMVSDDDLRDEEDYGALSDEVREECEKFGRLLGMKIPRDGDGYPPSAIKKIFLEYASTEDSARAERELAGRQFGPSIVGAIYFDEDEYAAGHLR